MCIDERLNLCRPIGARIAQRPSDRLGQPELPVGDVHLAHGKEQIEIGLLPVAALMLNGRSCQPDVL